MAFDLDPSYKQVPERLADFKEKHPEGCLRPADPSKPYWIEVIGEQTFIVYAAAAYRAPDDPTPGIGLAWEPFPGRTPYTKASELQNAETSAWGRAIVAVLASESKSVASAEDVRNRQADHAEPERQRQAPVVPSVALASAETHQSLRNAIDGLEKADRPGFLAWWANQGFPSIKTQDSLTDAQAELAFDRIDKVEAARLLQGPAGEDSRPLDGGPVEPSPAIVEEPDFYGPDAGPELMAEAFPDSTDEKGKPLPEKQASRSHVDEALARSREHTRGKPALGGVKK